MTTPDTLVVSQTSTFEAPSADRGHHHDHALRPDAKVDYQLNHAMIDGAAARAASEYAARFGEPGFRDPAGLYIEQHYDGYSAEDQEVWRELYARQEDHLNAHASRVWLDGARAIGLTRDAIPDLSRVNSNLKVLTGWQSRAVPGYVAAKPFFSCLARREFPTTVVIRPMSRIDYLPEPERDPNSPQILREIRGVALQAAANAATKATGLVSRRPQRSPLIPSWLRWCRRGPTCPRRSGLGSWQWCGPRRPSTPPREDRPMASNPAKGRSRPAPLSGFRFESIGAVAQ
jgi:hypothetical protein